MKLGKSALLEIVAIIQDALVNSKDASDGLRELDLTPVFDAVKADDVLELTTDYVAKHPRGSDWEDPSEEVVN